MKILLVEDEKSLAAAVAEVLRQGLYSVDVVYNGVDGLDYGVTGLYDLVILDVMLTAKSQVLPGIVYDDIYDLSSNDLN